MNKLWHGICYSCVSIYKVFNVIIDVIRKPFRSTFYMSNKVKVRLAFVAILVMFLLAESVGWFYNEFLGSGALFQVGTLQHEVKQYDYEGEFVEDIGELSTIVYEENMGVTTKSSKYIEVANIGTLDMEFNITFFLDGTIAEAGVMYYRIYEVTDEVYTYEIGGGFDTKLKAYADDNPIDPNIENCTIIPIKNMSLIASEIYNSSIKIQNEADDPNPRYFRLDYGMYESINSEHYSGSSIAVHASVYSTQFGKLSGIGDEVVWTVNNEAQMRSALDSAGLGDIIRLGQDFTLDGNINFYKNVNLDLDGYELTITGDLIFDYVDNRNLFINAVGTGRLNVHNDLIINTPKSNVHIMGSNDAYDIYVGNTFKVNSIQDLENNGLFLESVRIVKNTDTSVPVDIVLMSNSRLTVSHEVIIGFVSTTVGATNIELINNGTITQVQFQDMTLLTTFTKPQIFIYNLATIHGVVDGASIILPANATPYVSPTQGNTLIVRGVNSSDITVEGSEHFSEEDIEYADDDGTVIPIPGEDNAYIVYLSEPEHTIQGLLTHYFLAHEFPNPAEEIEAIEKLVVRTINAQYAENHDFDYMRSDAMLSLEYLSLETARVRDGMTLNRIKSGAMEDKASLRYLILPNTLAQVGEDAFAGVQLGHIPGSPSNPFMFLNIPNNVSLIEAGAFDTAKYVRFPGASVPTIASGGFNESNDGAKFFVNNAFIDNFRNSGQLNEANIFRDAGLSDNRLYFIYNVANGVGISLSIDPSIGGSTIGIPNNINQDTYTLPVLEIGPSAFRHTNITGSANLIIPGTTTKIGSYAFYDLEIYEANLGNITEIGASAFRYHEMTTLNLNSAETIGAYAFANGDELQEINFYEIRNIGNYAFYDCKYMARVNFNSTATRVVQNILEIDLDYGTDALFHNWGYYLNDRLRIYVPGGSTGDTTYLQLYKEKFPEMADFVFEKGELVGDYYYMAMPTNLYQYNVKEVTLNNYNGTPITGYQIISYQGADISDTYEIPEELTVNATTRPVIAIGQNAYRHSQVVGGHQVYLDTDDLLLIEEYSFYETAIRGFDADNVLTIGDYAFYDSELRRASFERLVNLGDYSLADISYLHYLHLGEVENIGDYAVSNAIRLYQLYILNDELNISLEESSFDNLGTNTANRTRIYVPPGTSNINYYKELLEDYAHWVYANGVIVGSYAHGGYEIGQYAVRAVNLPNHEGTYIDGYEIIDYHGANLTDVYEIPVAMTVGGVTLPVISIGRDAFINTLVEESEIININNSVLLHIGVRAFQDFDGIGTVNLSAVVSIGTRAFENTTIVSGTFENLNSVGVETFSGVDDLYRLDLGTIQEMPVNSVYDAPRLYQVFFEADGIDVNFHSSAFANVGTATSNRIRFYVTDAMAPSEIPYVNIYRNLFASAFQHFFFPKGHIVGSYSPANIPQDIGQYSVREVTLDNHNALPVVGWELIEYHGSELTSAYEIPESVTVGPDNYDIIAIGNRAYQHTEAVSEAVIEIENDNLIRVGEFAFFEFEGLSSFISESMVTLGGSAFRYNTLKIVEFPNLQTTGSYALGNNTQMNMVNLGYVTTIGSGLLYNNTAIHQIFFSTTASGGGVMTMTVGEDAFHNVGASLHGRLRIYVPPGNGDGGLSYVELYQNTLPGHLEDFIYRQGSIVGSYTYSSFTYDIGVYNVRQVTRNNFEDNPITGYEIIDYHGADITDSYEFPNELTVGETTLPVIGVGERAFRHVLVAAGHSWELSFPNSVFYIGELAFYERTIDFVNGNYFTIIDDYAFAGVNDMVNLSLNGIIEIGEGAFSDIPTLEVAAIGSGTETIGDYAFYTTGTFALHSFYIEAETPPTITDTTFPPVSPPQVELTHTYTVQTQGAHRIFTYYITVTNVGQKTVEYWSFTTDHLPYEINQISALNLEYELDGLNSLTLSNAAWNGTIEPMQSVDGIQFQFRTRDADYELPEFYPIPGQAHLTVYVPWDSWNDYLTATYWEDYSIVRIRTAYQDTFLYNLVNNETEIMITGFSGNDATLTIPDNFVLNEVPYPVTRIADRAFNATTSLEEITLPQYLRIIPNDLLGTNTSVHTIYVHGDNDFFTDINGVLFDKDEKVLIAYPNNRAGDTYTLPLTTEVIQAYGFSNAQNLDRINFNDDIAVISKNAFYENQQTHLYVFDSNTPPFFTANNVIPMHSYLQIVVPDNMVDNYTANFALQRYIDYIDDELVIIVPE